MVLVVVLRVLEAVVELVIFRVPVAVIAQFISVLEIVVELVLNRRVLEVVYVHVQ